MTTSVKHLGLKVMLCEAIGFSFLVFLVWLTEVIEYFEHLPHGDAYLDWKEALIESAAIIIFGLITIFFSWRLLRRVKYLEGFLPVCSFCKKIRVENKWMPIEEFISSRSETEFSHSFCPDCMEKHYGYYMEEKKPIKVDSPDDQAV